MATFEISYADDGIVFVNKHGKAEKEAFAHAMEDGDAIRVLRNDQKSAQSASEAAVNLLAKILNNPRLDEYKGATPLNQAVPAELRSAIRDLETEYLRPIFAAGMEAKGTTPGTIQKQWDQFQSYLRSGGTYANCKSMVTAYFAHCGKLPVTEQGNLLTIASIKKILANEKSKQDKPENTGIAGKLVAMSSDITNRTEKTELGDYATAIAALKSMLATYEGLYRESLERLTDVVGNTALDVQAMADTATAQAAQVDPLEKRAQELTAQYEAGELELIAYQIAMADIGYDVEMTEEEENA